MSRSLRSGGRFAQGCGIVAAFFMFRFGAFLDISLRRVEKRSEIRQVATKLSVFILKRIKLDREHLTLPRDLCAFGFPKPFTHFLNR